MRNFDEMNVDPTIKWDNGTLNHEMTSLVTHLNNLKKRGVDITNFDCIKGKTRLRGYYITFPEYCEALCNFDKYLAEAQKRVKAKRQMLDMIHCLKSASTIKYKIVNLIAAIETINNSDNPYQRCYDQFYEPHFRMYVEWMTMGFTSPFSSKELSLEKDSKKISEFQGMDEFAAILESSFLTLEEKIKLINIQYNTYHTLKGHDEFIKSVLDKIDLLVIPLEEQKVLIEKWWSINYGKGQKSLMLIRKGKIWKKKCH